MRKRITTTAVAWLMVSAVQQVQAQNTVIIPAPFAERRHAQFLEVASRAALTVFSWETRSPTGGWRIPESIDRFYPSKSPDSWVVCGLDSSRNGQKEKTGRRSATVA